MKDDEKPLEAAASAAAQELTRQLYADVKTWLTSVGRWAKKQLGKTATHTYESPGALLDALRKNLVKDGDRVTLECKPALFGPFLRDHFLSPIIGNHTSLRLGPVMQSSNPIFGILAQVTSQLTPVGLYPPVDKDVSQACLYPSDSSACGFLGLFPGVSDLVPYIPALLAARHTPYCNMPCHITGNIRLLSAESLTDAGFAAEVYEEIRQAGSIWVLDATDDDSECNPLGEGVTTQLWGGLYASGHLEISSGSLQVPRAVEALKAALDSAGYQPLVDQNRAGRKEIMLFAQGFRICMDSQFPYYSLHMDAELGIDFKRSRERFDGVCQGALTNLQQICKEDSVELANSLDMDFSYTNSAEAYTVMRSSGAENIRDPLMIAIRDWHRTRSKKA